MARVARTAAAPVITLLHDWWNALGPWEQGWVVFAWSAVMTILVRWDELRDLWKS